MFELFETQELVIRKIELIDAIQIFENWAQDEDVARYTTWSPHGSVEETQEYVQGCIDGWSQDAYTWLIERSNSAEIVGSFAARENKHKLDIGYLVSKNWWGNGFMTSVVKTFIDEAFKLDSIERIGAVCDVSNTASKRVMEKAGMDYEGVLFSWMVHPNIGAKARDCHSLSITRERYNKSPQGTT